MSRSIDAISSPSDVLGLTKPSPYTRRAFLSTAAAVAAGYTLATGPVNAAAITTDSSGLDVGFDKVTVAGGDMPVYFARPSGVTAPPVVLVAMEVFGLHEYIRDVTRRLGKLGAFAIAPDYYFRSGVDLTQMVDISELMPIVNKKADAELVADLDATVAFAKAKGGDIQRLGMIGFCRGGRSVWVYAAHSDQLKAGVSFYGSLVDPTPKNPAWPKSPIELAPEMKAPVLGLYGDSDQGIPLEQVETMKKALQAAGKVAEFKIFEDAPHGFHADYRGNYRKEAAEAAWLEMRKWLTQYKVLG